MLKLFRVFFICCVGFSVAEASTEGSIDESSGITEYPDYNWYFTPLECGPNEVSAGCINTCPPQKTCTDSQQYSCLAVYVPCTFQCHCKEGYIRKNRDGECIPIEECEIYCTSDEVYTDCKPSCLNETCSAMKNPPKCVREDSEPCEPGCICQYRYFRDDKDLKCIPDVLCPEFEYPLV